MIKNWISHLNGYRERRKLHPLTSHEITLYFILMEYCNELGWMDWFNASNGVIQGLSGLTRTAFHKARGDLASKGYIKYKDGSGNQSGKYLLVDFGTQTGTQTGTNLEPLNKPKTKTETKTKKDILSNIQKTPEWVDFEKMRKQIKKPLTERAVKMALAELEKLAPDNIELQKQILNQSTYYCWQGLFPLKGDVISTNLPNKTFSEIIAERVGV